MTIIHAIQLGFVLLLAIAMLINFMLGGKGRRSF